MPSVSTASTAPLRATTAVPPTPSSRSGSSESTRSEGRFMVVRAQRFPPDVTETVPAAMVTAAPKGTVV